MLLTSDTLLSSYTIQSTYMECRSPCQAFAKTLLTYSMDIGWRPHAIPRTRSTAYALFPNFRRFVLIPQNGQIWLILSFGLKILSDGIIAGTMIWMLYHRSRGVRKRYVFLIQSSFLLISCDFSFRIPKGRNHTGRPRSHLLDCKHRSNSMVIILRFVSNPILIILNCNRISTLLYLLTVRGVLTGYPTRAPLTCPLVHSLLG